MKNIFLAVILTSFVFTVFAQNDYKVIRVNGTIILQKNSSALAQGSQFSEDDMRMLLTFLDIKEHEYAKSQPFTLGEPLKVLRGFHLHGYPEAVQT